jgi:tagatose-6-phosphate ketose/aldose isomerase
VDALSELLSLPPEQKVARGLDPTPAEIAQPPDTWLSTYKLFHASRTEIKEFLSRSGVDTHSSSNVTIFLVGAGTSDYIGQPLAHLLRECWPSEVLAIPSTDLLTHRDDLMILERKYFWISFSRSGDSPEAIAVLEQARKTHPDTFHLVVSCNSNGRMFRDNADQTQVLAICLDDAVNDRGLAMTSAFSNVVIFGPCWAHMDHLGSYEELLSRVVAAGRSLLPRAADCASTIAKAGYTQATGADCRENHDYVRIDLGVAAWPHGGSRPRQSLHLFPFRRSAVQHYERNLLQEISKKRLARCRVVVTGDAFPGEDGLAQHYLHPARSSATGPCTIPDQFRPPVDVMF